MKWKTRALVLLLAACFVLCACQSSPAIIPEDHVCTLGTVQDKGLADITGLYEVNQNNIVNGFVSMYHPEIVKVDDKEYPYRMYFFGWAGTETNLNWPGCDAIFMARGKNLDEWEVYSQKKGTREVYWDTKGESGEFENAREWASVVYASRDDENDWFDNWHNGDPSVVYMDGVYYMAYSAYGMDKDGILSGTSGDTDGDISCVMGATSTDGINWTKAEYPLAIWEPEIGKKEPVTSDGSDFADGEFAGLYHRPSILYEDGVWKMWFDYITPSGLMSVGYAENRGDFMKHDDWVMVRCGSDALMPHMANPDVIKVGDTYFMYGDPDVTQYGATDPSLDYGDSWVKRQLMEFQSQDGINWTATGFIVPDSDTWADQIPTLYYEEGHLFLFYATQIGYGEKENNQGTGSYNFRYDNIRYMRRCIDYQMQEDVNFHAPYLTGGTA